MVSAQGVLGPISNGVAPQPPSPRQVRNVCRAGTIASSLFVHVPGAGSVTREAPGPLATRRSSILSQPCQGHEAAAGRRDSVGRLHRRSERLPLAECFNRRLGRISTTLPRTTLYSSNNRPYLSGMLFSNICASLTPSFEACWYQCRAMARSLRIPAMPARSKKAGS